eukprot:m51a1_g4633 putative Synaptobrevin (120) ;mRNA; r:328359-328813
MSSRSSAAPTLTLEVPVVGTPPRDERVAQLQREADDLAGLLHGNLKLATDNIEGVEGLRQRAERMREEAREFHRESRSVFKRFWRRHKKTIIRIAICVGVAILVLVLVVGGIAAVVILL